MGLVAKSTTSELNVALKFMKKKILLILGNTFELTIYSIRV